LNTLSLKRLLQRNDIALPTLSAERAGQQQLALIRANDQLAFFIPQRYRRRRSPSAPQWHIYARSAAGY
jgi:hypothetical protein